MRFDYRKICQDLIKGLSPKQKEVVLFRFALNGEGAAKDRETLEAVGKRFGVTRERVRQIEESGLRGIKSRSKKYSAVFQYFKNYFQSNGGLKKEDVAFAELGEKKWGNQVYFLLSLDDKFRRFGENRDFWSSWSLSDSSLNLAKKTVDNLLQKLEESGKPLVLKELTRLSSLKASVLESYLAISKKIQKNREGFFGPKSWPEINPRGVKDKALLVFKKEQKPLHFTEVSKSIAGSLVQTVHNELIRDPRFVLVGRGVYALKEWGYEPGQVKDVIQKTLKERGRPLTREEILSQVLKQRMVKENTVFLNLGNKKNFSKDSQGRYWIREA